MNPDDIHLDGHDRAVDFVAADGWPLGGLLRPAAPHHDPIGATAAPGVVLVPGSRHERDAYTTLADTLTGAGLASLRIDVRGRGSSRGPHRYADMAPLQRRRVTDDVHAALARLAEHDGVDAGNLALVVEQDTAADAVAAARGDPPVRAVVVISARHGARLVAALTATDQHQHEHRHEHPQRPPAVFGLVSTEDRAGLRATVDAFLAGPPDTSRLEVFQGLGFGTTMFSTRQFDHPDAEPLESMITTWLGERLRR